MLFNLRPFDVFDVFDQFDVFDKFDTFDAFDGRLQDLSSLRFICECVSRRASFMASAGITALLKKMDYKDVVIAIDGSLFRSYDRFIFCST